MPISQKDDVVTYGTVWMII